ncbi:unnamed protein product [Rotaria sp. Silwood1]|nr:unnamed protein product [Rotaria sp. Silwood1]
MIFSISLACITGLAIGLLFQQSRSACSPKCRSNFLTKVSETDEDGNIFIGQIDNNGKRQEHGILVWAQLGMTYDGYWKDNSRVGIGELIWSDGHRYKGQWKDNERSGLGVMQWPNGQRYIGAWLNNRQYGEGIQFYPDGQMYRGTWQNDLRSGLGIQIETDGAKYEGQWWSDMKDGNGTYTDKDGNKIVGIWKSDALHTVLLNVTLEL